MTKTRTDAWGEQLPEAERREIYSFTKPPTEEEAKAGRPYLRNFERDVRPFLSLRGIVEPSVAGWYRFLGRMREEEAAQTVISVETSKRIARGIQAAEVDAALAADMLTALAVDAASKHNEKAMQILASAASMFKAADQRERELRLKDRAQQTKDEQLKLAREKFAAAERRLKAVQEAVKTTKANGGGLSEEALAKIEQAVGML